MSLVVSAGLALGQSVCLWQALFGVPCPGCGMTRALLALARGDVHAAWSLNRSSVIVGPILLKAVAERVWSFVTSR